MSFGPVPHPGDAHRPLLLTPPDFLIVVCDKPRPDSVISVTLREQDNTPDVRLRGISALVERPPAAAGPEHRRGHPRNHARNPHPGKSRCNWIAVSRRDIWRTPELPMPIAAGVAENQMRREAKDRFDEDGSGWLGEYRFPRAPSKPWRRSRFWLPAEADS